MFLSVVRALLFIIGCVLIVDGIFLFSLTLVNFGSVVPFCIGVIFVIHALWWNRIQDLCAGSRLLCGIWKAAWVAFFLWLISFVIFCVFLNRTMHEKHTGAVKAIIVLGSGTVDGKVSPILKSRLDTAAALYKKNPHAAIVTTGGVGIGRVLSESHVMTKYLESQYAIPYTYTLKEQKSTSTDENLRFSEPLLAGADVALSDPIAIVTSDFHTVRAKAIAKRLGYTNVSSVPSPMPLYGRYNSWFREYFAFMSGWLLDEY